MEILDRATGRVCEGGNRLFMRMHNGQLIAVWSVLLAILTGIPGCAGKPNTNFTVKYVPSAEFLLGPEDVLIVTTWRNQDLSKEVIVRPDGKITMPLIGDIQASGITAEALGKMIAERLNEYMSNPIVSVQVKEINSYFVYVLGEVKNPGKFQLKSFTTVLQVISLAGGFTQFANRNGIRVITKTIGQDEKPRQIEIPVSFGDIIAGRANPGDFYVKSGDLIVVP